MKTNTRLALQLLAGFLFVAAVILIGIFVPIFGGVAKRGPMTVSLSNAKQLATGCRLYALDHGGRLPVHLDELIPDYITDIKSLRGIVGDSVDKPLCTYDWLYFGAGFTDENSPTILVASPHVTGAVGKPQKRVVVLGDVSGRIFDEDEYQKMLSETVRQMRELDDRQHAPQPASANSPAK